MNFPIQMTPEDADNLRHSEAEHSYLFALLFGGFGVVMLVVVGGAGLVMQIPVPTMQWLVFAIIGMSGFIIGGILFTGLRRGRGHISKYVNEFVEWSKLAYDSEFAKLHPAAPPAPPAAPAAPEVPLLTSGRADPILLGGFDKADLRSLVLGFVSGQKWTEDALIGKLLPVTGEKLTRERYNALMTLFTSRGVIVNRGGPGNKPGKLAVKESGQILRILLNAPQKPPTPPTGDVSQVIEQR